mmetsp:Transcript_116937/g.337954  ORF Transcript_116937/g.337954 Transcript_116937/m.337954 type:complete len:275 (+) Transcript_116937:394-1218(+)
MGRRPGTALDSGGTGTWISLVRGAGLSGPNARLFAHEAAMRAAGQRGGLVQGAQGAPCCWQKVFCIIVLGGPRRPGRRHRRRCCRDACRLRAAPGEVVILVVVGEDVSVEEVMPPGLGAQELEGNVGGAHTKAQPLATLGEHLLLHPECAVGIEGLPPSHLARWPLLFQQPPQLVEDLVRFGVECLQGDMAGIERVELHPQLHDGVDSQRPASVGELQACRDTVVVRVDEVPPAREDAAVLGDEQPLEALDAGHDHVAAMRRRIHLPRAVSRRR